MSTARRTARSSDELLAAAVKKNEAYGILDESCPGAATWLQGGCHLLALAAKPLIPGGRLAAVVAVGGEPIQLALPEREWRRDIHHLLVYQPDSVRPRCYDGDGWSTPEALVHRFRTIERLPAAVLVDVDDRYDAISEAAANGFAIAPAAGVESLRAFLKTEMGW